MQRIERYGVIALVLLLVTIAAVSFWEDDAAADRTRSARANEETRELSTPRDADRALPDTAQPTREERLRELRRKEERRHRRLQEARRTQEDELARNSQAASKPGGDLPFPSELSSDSAGRGARSTQATTQRGAAERGMRTSEVARGTRGSRGSEAQSTPSGSGAKPSDRQAEGAERASADDLATREARRAREARGDARWHVVRAGETLSEIAYDELGTSKRWPEIAALNGGGESIYEGQKLRLPDSASGGASPAVASSVTKPSAGGSTYVVEKGDMLSVIAQERLGSAQRWREIAALNPKIDPDRLLEGTVLTLPKSSANSTALAAGEATPSRSTASRTGRVR